MIREERGSEISLRENRLEVIGGEFFNTIRRFLTFECRQVNGSTDPKPSRLPQAEDGMLRRISGDRAPYMRFVPVSFVGQLLKTPEGTILASQ
jgi:hypothetical protein